MITNRLKECVFSGIQSFAGRPRKSIQTTLNSSGPRRCDLRTKQHSHDTDPNRSLADGSSRDFGNNDSPDRLREAEVVNGILEPFGPWFSLDKSWRGFPPDPDPSLITLGDVCPEDVSLPSKLRVCGDGKARLIHKGSLHSVFARPAPRGFSALTVTSL
jgi:hypothetical protein